VTYSYSDVQSFMVSWRQAPPRKYGQGTFFCPKLLTNDKNVHVQLLGQPPLLWRRNRVLSWCRTTMVPPWHCVYFSWVYSTKMQPASKTSYLPTYVTTNIKFKKSILKNWKICQWQYIPVYKLKSSFVISNERKRIKIVGNAFFYYVK